MSPADATQQVERQEEHGAPAGHGCCHHTNQHDRHGAHGGHAHRGHGWMMVACCIPMLAIAIALVATGVAGLGVIAPAIMCILMMAVMMRGMSPGESER